MSIIAQMAFAHGNRIKAQRPQKCIGCNFYEDDKVSDDGDWVEGWGCCCPIECPRNSSQLQENK